MILNVDLKKNILDLLNENNVPVDELVYAMPFDVDIEAKFLEDSYLLVTRERVLVVQSRKLIFDFAIPELRLFKLVNTSDGAYIYARAKAGTDAATQLGVAEEDVFVLRTSAKYKIQMAYIAKGVECFINGEDKIIKSKEKDNYCQICSNALAGARICRKCNNDKQLAFKRIWQIARDYKGEFLKLFVPIILVVFATIGQRYVEKDFIDNTLLSGKGNAQDIVVFFIVMLVLGIIMLTASLLRIVTSNKMGARISQSLRDRVYKKLNDLPIEFVDRYDAGQLMNRVMHDTERVRSFITEVGGEMLNLIFIIVVVAILMFLINWKLALISIAFFPVAVLLTRMRRKRFRRLWRRQIRWKDISDAQLQDAISGIRIVKSFGQERRESDKYIENTNALTKYTRESELFWATFSPLLTFIVTAGSILMIGVGAFDVISASLSVGELNQMISFANMMYGQLNFLVRLPRMLSHVNIALDRIYEILDEEIYVPANQIESFEMRGEVKFEKVNFGYKSYDPVLSNINLDIKAGEKIGIVGESGAGKSTLVNLIMRLYKVDSGEILLDGNNIDIYSDKNYHKQLGVVLQESYLFSGSIAQNLKFAKPDASMDEIIYAAKMANAHDFICKFPDAYDTYVGEKGNRLSGGEKQRIAIARALLPNPKMLILDEPTSSLDLETEVLIQEALERLTVDKTTFIIAHRLATLKNCDKIMVISDHEIAEFGSHEKLMEKKGIYYDLVMAQLDLFSVEENSEFKHS